MHDINEAPGVSLLEIPERVRDARVTLHHLHRVASDLCRNRSLPLTHQDGRQYSDDERYNLAAEIDAIITPLLQMDASEQPIERLIEALRRGLTDDAHTPQSAQETRSVMRPDRSSDEKLAG